MKVLVLGASGMLGSMVYQYLKSSLPGDVLGTGRGESGDLIHFDVHEGIGVLERKLGKGDYLINCIGITKPYCHDDDMAEVKNALLVNSLFPHTLAELAERKGSKVIQIATDCAYSGSKGKYREDSIHDAGDVYGKSKSLGEVKTRHFLNIRCSIIGPERFHKVFLLEWFLAQPKGTGLKGFSHHLWNGVTTLQFAKLCQKIISGGYFDSLIEQSNIHHLVVNPTVNKYELLCLFNKVFDKKLIIEEDKGDGKAVDRTLATKYGVIAGFYPPSRIEKALEELKKYTEETKFYHV